MGYAGTGILHTKWGTARLKSTYWMAGSPTKIDGTLPPIALLDKDNDLRTQRACDWRVIKFLPALPKVRK